MAGISVAELPLPETPPISLGTTIESPSDNEGESQGYLEMLGEFEFVWHEQQGNIRKDVATDPSTVSSSVDPFWFQSASDTQDLDSAEDSKKLGLPYNIGHSETVQEQPQRLTFPSYSEEDILNWDVAIENAPPRPSGIIRVKLKYKGRSKPIPVENPWEE